MQPWASSLLPKASFLARWPQPVQFKLYSGSIQDIEEVSMLTADHTDSIPTYVPVTLEWNVVIRQICISTENSNDYF